MLSYNRDRRFGDACRVTGKGLHVGGLIPELLSCISASQNSAACPFLVVGHPDYLRDVGTSMDGMQGDTIHGAVKGWGHGAEMQLMTLVN